MKALKQIFALVSLTLLVVTIHFFIAYALPYPFDKINILFIYLVLYLLYTESGTVVWLAFLSHVFIEVFPSTTFGITLMSSTLALLFSYWLHIYYVTNRKWYGGALVLFFTLLSYRFLYTLFLFFTNRLRGEENIMWLPLFQLSFWEFLLTTITFLFIFFIVLKSSRRFSQRMSR